MNSRVKVISFGHRIPSELREQFTKKYFSEADFFEVRFNLIMTKELKPQVNKLVMDALILADVGTQAPFIILPGVNVASVMVVSLIHGLTGRFPFIIELTKTHDFPYSWRLKEVHDLDAVRSLGRDHRFPKFSPKKGV
uniref:Uncharacterized protein n=1 Tax=viral metagenome TaxID=1070528 RepID=A0A6M3IIJ1_9ZZZZ